MQTRSLAAYRASQLCTCVYIVYTQVSRMYTSKLTPASYDALRYPEGTYDTMSRIYLRHHSISYVQGPTTYERTLRTRRTRTDTLYMEPLSLETPYTYVHGTIAALSLSLSLTRSYSRRVPISYESRRVPISYEIPTSRVGIVSLYE